MSPKGFFAHRGWLPWRDVGRPLSNLLQVFADGGVWQGRYISFTPSLDVSLEMFPNVMFAGLAPHNMKTLLLIPTWRIRKGPTFRIGFGRKKKSWFALVSLHLPILDPCKESHYPAWGHGRAWRFAGLTGSSWHSKFVAAQFQADSFGVRHRVDYIWYKRTLTRGGWKDIVPGLYSDIKLTGLLFL